MYSHNSPQHSNSCLWLFMCIHIQFSRYKSVIYLSRVRAKGYTYRMIVYHLADSRRYAAAGKHPTVGGWTWARGRDRPQWLCLKKTNYGPLWNSQWKFNGRQVKSYTNNMKRVSRELGREAKKRANFVWKTQVLLQTLSKTRGQFCNLLLYLLLYSLFFLRYYKIKP